MARQEISSTFSDGLMMDLNPINTPKSVLTDCLNGTYITYNGNEFVLQNDMGNYKLKNCKLPTNFIPVGVKGYGDILYIVSYNPITNETEIGSYPAPQSIFTTGETEDALEATPDQLAPFAWGPETDIPDIEVEYPTIIRTNKKPIFIFAGTDEETYKLNPGDEFRFSGNVDIPTFKYQHLNFYIIDEDNKLYDIDDTQIYNENGSLVSLDLRKVFWETPGWLAAQYDLYVPDKFNLNLRSLNVPEFLVAQPDDGTSSQVEREIPLDDQIPSDTQFKVSMDLSSQTIITDKLFQTELDKNFNHSIENDPWEKNPANVYDHLYIRYLIKQNQNPPDEGEDDYGTFKGIVVSLDDGTTKDYTNGVTEGDYVYYDIPVWKHNYQDDIITAYNNIRPIWFCNNPNKNQQTGDLDIANYHGVVELTAYPIIKYNGLTLKYTQFSTTQRFPLNTLKNSSDITIADSIYKWSVDDDSCTISFNINGPFINASDITGRYEIYRINLFNYSPQFPSVDSEPPDNPISLSNYSVNDTNSKIKHKILTKDSDGNPASFEFIRYNKDPRTKIDTLNTFNFTQRRKLLMCEGNLSNLVLYGQNTININWDNSNEYYLLKYKNIYTNPDFDSKQPASEYNPGYVLDSNYPLDEQGNPTGYKTINFSKEGGIYMFRIILEQNGNQLAESKQVLIPSEVFNEWFGSVDNYNEIYLNQWVDNYIQNIKVNAFEIFSYDYDIRPNTSHAVLACTLNDKRIQIPIDNNISDIFPVSGTNENTNHLFNKPQNGTITFIVDYNEILSNLKFSYNKQQNINNGNLYCPLILNNLTLKQGTSEILSGTESIIDSSTMNLENIQILNSKEINLVVQSESVKKPRIEKVYPFKGLGYGESNQLVILVLHHYQSDRDGVWGQFAYYKNNNETAPIGGGASAKGQGRVLFDTSTLCSDPIGKMNDYGVAYAQFAAKNFANNCGASSVPGNKGVGALARVDTIDWQGAAHSGTVIAAGDGHSPGTFDEGTENGDKFLLFRAYNKASSANNMATVAIQFNNYLAKQSFSKLLEHVYIQEKKDGEDDYYVPKILTTNIELSPNFNITVNKLNVQTIVKLLKVDDCIYMFNTNMFNININSILEDDYFKNINLLIAQNNSINNYTQTPNLSISPLTLNFDWLDNDQYNYLYYNLNTEITDYNNISDKQTTSEIYQETFQFDEDAPNQNALRNICDNKLKFINGIPEINNIAWNISSWNYTVLRNFRKGDGPWKTIDNTGLVFMTYIEDFVL